MKQQLRLALRGNNNKRAPVAAGANALRRLMREPLFGSGSLMRIDLWMLFERRYVCFLFKRLLLVFVAQLFAIRRDVKRALVTTGSARTHKCCCCFCFCFSRFSGLRRARSGYGVHLWRRVCFVAPLGCDNAACGLLSTRSLLLSLLSTAKARAACCSSGAVRATKLVCALPKRTRSSPLSNPIQMRADAKRCKFQTDPPVLQPTTQIHSPRPSKRNLSPVCGPASRPRFAVQRPDEPASRRRG